MKLAISVLVFLFLIAPGLRMLTLARKTKQVPEFLAGLYFVGAALGFSLRIFGVAITFDQPELARMLNAVGHIALASGTIAMAIFTQRVFYAQSQGARVFTYSLILAIVASTIYAMAGDQDVVLNAQPIAAANFFRVIPTAWACFESFRYWRAMKKRGALGLADPIVTNRFGLWTLWTAGVTTLPLSALVLRLFAIATLTGSELATEDVAQIQSMAIAVVRVVFLIAIPISVVALSLGFFPPDSYLERIRQRAEASA